VRGLGLRVAGTASVVGLGLALLVASSDRGTGRHVVAGVEGTATTATATSAPGPAASEPTTTDMSGTATTAPATTNTTAAATTTTERKAPWVEVSASEATAATLTTITVRAHDPVNLAPTVNIDFGDGTSTDSYRAFYPGYKPCRGGGGEVQLDFTHAYRVPGTYTVRVSMQRCTGRSDDVVAAEPLRLTVAPPPDGNLPSNGPRAPMVEVAPHSVNADEGGAVSVHVGALDRDGYLRTFRIDWGDGSAVTEVERPLTNCHDTPTSYPRGDIYGSPEGDTYGFDVRHHYATPGTYRITVTVESTGCDGASVQTATDTGEATVP
jgi:hypothetical protein